MAATPWSSAHARGSARNRRGQDHHEALSPSCSLSSSSCVQLGPFRGCAGSDDHRAHGDRRSSRGPARTQARDEVLRIDARREPARRSGVPEPLGSHRRDGLRNLRVVRARRLVRRAVRTADAEGSRLRRAVRRSERRRSDADDDRARRKGPAHRARVDRGRKGKEPSVELVSLYDDTSVALSPDESTRTKIGDVEWVELTGTSQGDMPGMLYLVGTIDAAVRLHAPRVTSAALPPKNALPSRALVEARPSMKTPSRRSLNAARALEALRSRYVTRSLPPPPARLVDHR